MKKIIATAAFVLLGCSSAFAFDDQRAAVEIRASEHTCSEMARAVQTYGKVFIRVGLFGRSFRYPPFTCGHRQTYGVISLRDKNGQSCRLNYACVQDPDYRK